MWGVDGTKVFTLEDGYGWVFTAVEHWNGECVGAHITKIGDRFAAMEPVLMGISAQFGSPGPDVARPESSDGSRLPISLGSFSETDQVLRYNAELCVSLGAGNQRSG
jgi:hypothetical protein